MSRQPNKHFPIFDLDIDSMTLMPELNLDTVKMYHHTKNDVTDTHVKSHRDTMKILSAAYCGVINNSFHNSLIPPI